MHILKELLTMHKELSLHIVVFAIVVALWLLVLMILQNRLSMLLSKLKTTWKRNLLVVSIGPVVLFVVNTILFFLLGNYKSPSVAITITIGSLTLGLILVMICFKTYFVFFQNSFMHILCTFITSLLVLSASWALICSLPSLSNGLEKKTDRQQETPSDAHLDPNEEGGGINHEEPISMIDSLGDKITTSPGALFAFFVGTATLVALLYTISSLHAQHTRISTYRQYLRESNFLLNRYLDGMWKEIDEIEEKLAKKEKSLRRESPKGKVDDIINKKRNKKKDQFCKSYSVMILCFTPLNGIVTLGPKAPELTSYLHSFELLLGMVKARWMKCKVICLVDDEGLYESELDGCEYDRERLVKAAEAGCDLAQLYLGFSTQHAFDKEGDRLWAAYSDSLKFIKDKVGDSAIACKRDKLPTFHFMITKNPKKTVAIVGNPLRLPPPLRAPVGASPNNSNKERKVDMIGFRTEDMHIVESLEETFNFYKDLST